MNGWTTLLKGNLILKAMSLVLFAIIARLFDASEIVVYALIPSLSIVFVSVSGFGILTVCEKYVPTCSDPQRSELVLGAFLLQLIGLIALVAFFFYTFDYWISKGIMPAKWQEMRGLVCLSIFLFALSNVQLTLLNILGKFAYVNKIRIVFESFNKFLPIVSVLVLGGGVLPMYFFAQLIAFLLAMNYLRHEVSIGLVSLKPILAKLFQYPYLYVESIFNAFRNVGDNLVVSAVLGEAQLSIYYVLKRAAEQIEPLGSAILKASVPHFSKLKSVARAERLQSINLTLEKYGYGCFQTGLLYVPVCVVVLYLVAGQQYINDYAASILLVIHYALLICTSMALKVVLNFSKAVYRVFYIGISFLLFCGIFVFWLKDFGVLGASASLVLVDVFMLSVLGAWLLGLGVRMIRWIGLLTLEIAILVSVLFWISGTEAGFSVEFLYRFILLIITCMSLVWFCTTKDIKSSVEARLRSLLNRLNLAVKS